MSETELDYIDNKLFSAARRFNWSKDFVVYGFGTLQDMVIDKTSPSDFFYQNTGNTQNAGPDEPPIGHEDSDCNCRWGWCGDGGSCEESACNETTLGCGALGLGSCSKICSAID